MQELNLSKDTPTLDLSKEYPSLKSVKCVLSWVTDTAMTQEAVDLDIFAYILEQGKVSEVPGCVVYFNFKKFMNGVVDYPRDNRGNDNAPEELFVQLDKIPANKDSIELFVFIDKAELRKHDFSCLSSGKFTIFDCETNEEVQSYQLTNYVSGNALHIGTLENKGSWQFKPIGEVAQATPNQVLAALV